MSTGYPDYQDYAQWLGPILDQGTNVGVPGAGLTLGPYTVTNYAQLVIGLNLRASALTVQTTQTRAAAPSSVAAITTWQLAAFATDIRPVTLFGDTISVLLLPTVNSIGVDYAVWGSNSPEPLQRPVGDTGSSVGLAAVMPYYFDGLDYRLVRTLAEYHTRATAQVVAGTPATLWTPGAGLRFRLMAGELSLSVAGQILLKDGGVEFLRSPQLGAGSTWSLPPIGNGYISANANAVLSVDVSATGNVGGWVGGTEE